jgi:uncharacterized membrane protein
VRTLIATFATMLFGHAAAAGTLHCSFTEPFFSIEYDSATSRMVYTSPNEVDENGEMIPYISENAKLVADPNWQEPPTFYLKNGEETVVTLLGSGRGSDGMSESQFPFQAWSMGREGGCSTGKIPAWEIYDFHEDFGIPF